MKKVFFLSILFYSICTPAMNYASNSDNWYNQPLGLSDDNTSVSLDRKKNNTKSGKKGTPWYKKSSAKYAAGTLVSGIAAVYALQRYMAAPVIVTALLPMTQDSDNVGTDVSQDSSSATVNNKPLEKKNSSDTVSTENKVADAGDENYSKWFWMGCGSAATLSAGGLIWIGKILAETFPLSNII